MRLRKQVVYDVRGEPCVAYVPVNSVEEIVRSIFSIVVAVLRLVERLVFWSLILIVVPFVVASMNDWI